MARTLIMLTGRTHGRTGAREASHRKSAAADLRAMVPISGKPEIGGRRPGPGRSSFEGRPHPEPSPASFETPASRAPQDEGDGRRTRPPQDDGQHQAATRPHERQRYAGRPG